MNKTKKRFASANPSYWPAWFLIGLSWVITQLPYRWQYKIGVGIGHFLHLFPSKFKRIAEINVKLCFPELGEAQRKILIKKNFISAGIGMIEVGLAGWLSDEKLEKIYRLHGLEHAKKALAKGKGIILLGLHVTPMEISGRAVAREVPFSIIFRPHKKKIVSFIFEWCRRRHYNNYFPRDSTRNMIRDLKNNGAIWLAYDVDGGRDDYVFAPFFGVSSATLTSVSRIARMTGASVIPIRFYRHENELGYDLHLLPALENFPGHNFAEDATRLNKVLEDAIRNKPEQFVWQYKRFKTRPTNEPRFY